MIRTFEIRTRLVRTSNRLDFGVVWLSDVPILAFHCIDKIKTKQVLDRFYNNNLKQKVLDRFYKNKTRRVLDRL